MWKVIFVLLVFTFACSHKPDQFKYKVAIIGNPSVPDAQYTDQRLEELKKLGFNTLQLNIAWGTRPADEPMNLEDILPYKGEKATERQTKWLNEIRHRSELVKKHGFRTMLFFPAPYIANLYGIINHPEKIDSATNANSVLREEVMDRYRYLISTLADEIPNLDDLLIYNFDGDAMLGNEFGSDSIDAGIPLHERLPKFLNMIRDIWASKRPDGIVWWEPWEMSAGQIYMMLDSLPSRNFGLMLHSNIGEVQLTRPVDGWLRTISLYAKHRNMPLVVELFLSSSNEETEPFQNVAAPQLVCSEISAVRSLPHVSGVKEYYGLNLSVNDVNLQMASRLFKDSETEDAALDDISSAYDKASSQIKKAWYHASLGISFIPWDLTWNIRHYALDWKMVYHSWDAYNQRGKLAVTPSWMSSRRAVFMLTDNEENHHTWLIEDVGLRYTKAADELDKAIALYNTAFILAPDSLKKQITLFKNDLLILSVLTRNTGLHCMETLAAYNIRRTIEAKKVVPEFYYQRLETLLEQDVQNQSRYQMPNKWFAPASDKLMEYKADRQKWVINNLLFKKVSQ